MKKFVSALLLALAFAGCTTGKKKPSAKKPLECPVFHNYKSYHKPVFKQTWLKDNKVIKSH
jgi:hypothetical protein